MDGRFYSEQFETDQLQKTALSDRTLEEAKNGALKYIGIRMRTRHELAVYLQKKGYSVAVVQEVMAFLTGYGYLDDAAYCKAWIHDKLQFHPCGRNKLAAELGKKVSDRQLVRDSIEAYYPHSLELEYAARAAKQKQCSHIGKKPLTREQLARFLYGRGYTGTVIASVVSDMQFSMEENEAQY